MEITGKLTKVLPLESGEGKSGKSWKKQGFVIETDGKYPKKICLTAWGDTIEYLAKVQHGAEVTCSTDISSREYNEKWYTDVKAWKIETNSEVSVPEPNQTEQPDDLPF